MGTGGVWVWGRGPIKIPLALTAAGGEGRRVSVNLLGLCPSLLSRGCSAALKGKGQACCMGAIGGQWALPPQLHGMLLTSVNSDVVNGRGCGGGKRGLWYNVRGWTLLPTPAGPGLTPGGMRGQHRRAGFLDVGV